jgi:two-component system phosphate regulon response regulator PhoB
MGSSKRILVVDGDALWRERIAAGLASPLLEIAAVATAREALEYASREKPDLIAMELALPDVSGLGLCRLLREDPALAHIGLVMVTDHASEIDRVLAFEAGVDDFLPKPFYARELASRVGAVLRRSGDGSERHDAHEYPVDAHSLVSVHAAEGTVLVGDRRVDLTPREYRLLAALVGQAGRVVTRRQLIASVWGPESAHSDRVVDAHVKAIRRKLGEAKDCVETVRGVGYRFSETAARG